MENFDFAVIGAGIAGASFAARVAPRARVRWPAVIATDPSFYCKSDSGLALASPADETPITPCDAQPEELDTAFGVDRIESASRLTVRGVVRSGAGLRIHKPVRTPSLGYDARMKDCFWLAGQGGCGVQPAPALSEPAAALAFGEPLPAALATEEFPLDAVLPQRFAPAAPLRGSA